jgi:putative addiction module component (TIGR02574 family)
MTTKQLINKMVSLPVDERVLLVDSLLMSLNHPETEIEKKWLTVAKRRLSELKSGDVKAIEGQEVFEKIWNRFEE